jgi:hypothetical protein
VGGAITGLTGIGLVLRLNDGSDLAVAADGPFAFGSRLASGASYAVTVFSQPASPSQSCSVANGAGTVASVDVTSVTVTCINGQYTVGGSVAGLTGTGLELQNNGGDVLAISANGAFTFAGRLASGANYNVSVRAHPTGQNCVVGNASGSVSNANVNNIAVACASDAFSIGGTVTGLEGTGLTLQLNGANDLSVRGNGTFAFATGLRRGSSYRVTVKTQPSAPSQTCIATDAEGTVTGTVANVRVTCTKNSHSVGGSVSGLRGSGLTLKLNGANDVPIASDGQFTFATPVASGSSYEVSIGQQPSNPTQVCSVANGAGTIANAPVTSIRVTCASSTFNVGGTVTGLLGQGLVLLNNGTDRVEVGSDGVFSFAQPVANGGGYRVTIGAPPSNPAQSCTVTNGQGTIQDANVTNVAVICTTGEFTIGGSVAGLSGTGLVLRNNDGDDLELDANGAFTFQTALPTGATYNVSIAVQPTNPLQSCSVENGTGQVGSENVTRIRVECEKPREYTVGGRVEDLRGFGLMLQNNGTDDLWIGANGRFKFRTTLPSGSPYNVTVGRQPSRSRCEVFKGTGTVGTRNVDDVDVKCRREDD